MDFINSHLLTLILFSPVAGAMIVAAMPREEVKLHRWLAFLFSLVPLALALVAWAQFRSGQGYQFVEQAVWYEAVNSSYHVGVDGISLPMVLLTTLLTPLGILISFSVTDRPRTYMTLFLMLETGMLGVFLALDLLLFFVFWEVGLVPMYFLINQWGSKNRQYASFKFFVYTMAASLGLLLAIQLIGISAGTFDLLTITERWPSLPVAILGLSPSAVKAIAFWAFTIAFALKVPVWPLHTWLPDAHTEAPTAGSMLLAGVLLKLGAYGFLRLVLPLYPEQARTFAPILGLLAVASIIAGAFASWGQTDFKRLVAYSSINHMGFVVLGIAAAAWAVGSPLANDALIALNGAVLQMWAHGLSAAGMFLLVGVIYERTHTRDLTQYGGLWPLAPAYGGILVFTAMASLGLPGLAGFVSEFLVVRGSWPIFTLYTALAMVGLLFTGAYILKALQRVLHGPVNEHWRGHALEINAREVLAIAPLMVLMLLTGVWPAWIADVINRTVVALFG